jgi:tRNA-2-methylthio-N6-dimethylallyladenosine synthase
MIPDAGLTADILVGYPSERERDFKATCRALKELEFNSTFVFKYSPRPPALSSYLVDDVPEETKKKRNTDLLALQKKISHQINKRMISTEQEILVEGKSRMSDKDLMGRTRNNTPCVFRGSEDLVGQLVRVQVKGASPFTLKAELIKEEQ